MSLNKAKEQLDRAIQALRQEKNEEKNRIFFANLLTSLSNVMTQTLSQIRDENTLLRTQVLGIIEAIKQIKIENDIKVPEIKSPEVKVPEIDLSAITEAIKKIEPSKTDVDLKPLLKELKTLKNNNVELDLTPLIKEIRKIKPKEVNVPDEVALKGIDRKKPLPVLNVDIKGKPVQWVSTVGGGGGRSGKANLRVSGQEVSSDNPIPITNTDKATDYKVLSFNMDEARTDTALNGSDFTFYWVKILAYTGDDSDLDTFDQYLRLGTSSDDKIPLSTLLRPDSDVIFEGKITGDIYLTNTAQSSVAITLIAGT